jgi:hypothetical protein
LGEGGATLDPNRRAYKKIKYLTEKDFPESKILFKDDGTFLTE